MTIDLKATHMFEGHENSDFLHDLSDLKLSPDPDALTSNLPVTSGIKCEVDRCERSRSKALRSYDIDANPL
jgi:hypothetical protein